jgi:hypothetical protein
LIVEIMGSMLNVEGHVVAIGWPNAGGVRPVDLTGTSSHPEWGYSESLTTLFHGGFYLSPMTGSSSLSLAICIDIATLWA